MKTDNNRTDSKKIKRGQDKPEEVEYIYTPAVEIRLIVGMIFLMAFVSLSPIYSNIFLSPN